MPPDPSANVGQSVRITTIIALGAMLLSWPQRPVVEALASEAPPISAG